MQPWYAQKAAAPSEAPAPGNTYAADTGQSIALTPGTDLPVMDTKLHKHKHRHKKDRKKQGHDKDSKQSKMQTVLDLRAERQAREDAERLRQNRLLHQHRGVARTR